MSEIKIYAPNDCIVEILQNTDTNYSEKTYSNQKILITSNKAEFNLPFMNAKLTELSEKKDRMVFVVENKLIELKFSIKADTKINIKNQAVLKKNLKYKKENVIFSLENTVDKSIEVTATINVIAGEKYNIENLNQSEYKSKDLICSLIFETNKIWKSQINEFESKYKKAAKQFVEAVGGKENYSEVYNCMTRVRFKIRDKALVHENVIMNNVMVKGTVWSGDEIQIIIGGEAGKIKDEIVNLDIVTQMDTDNINEKRLSAPIGQRILGAIGAIVGPNIPIIMAAGIISAIYSILVQTGAAIDLGQGSAEELAKADILSAVLFIMSKTGLMLFGVFFCVNTVRYFGGSWSLGLLIGLALVSRYFYTTGTTDPSLYETGSYVISNKYGIRGWYLFSISDYPIVIRSYEGSVLPFVVSGIIAASAEKWIKTWVPDALSIIVTYALAFILAVVPTFFLLGPILSLIEFWLAQFTFLIADLPFGIGVGLMAMIWQPLVVIGVHIPVVTAIMMPMLQGTPSLLMPAISLAVWAQVGVAVGIFFKTKNSNLRTIISGAVPAGLFGITEPIIYGVTLPKVKPFLLACLAAFPIGMLSGWMGLTADIPAGQGIFALLAHNEINEMMYVLMTYILVIALGAVLGIFFYVERWNESSYARKVSNKILNILKKAQYKDLVEVDKEIKELLVAIKGSKKIISDYEVYLGKLSSIENKLMKTEFKEEKVKKSLHKKIDALLKKSNSSDDSIKEAIRKYNEYNLNDQKEKFLNDKKIMDDQNALIIKNYRDKIDYLEKLSIQITENISQKTGIEDLKTFAGGYKNAINTVEIGFGYLHQSRYGISKESKKQMKLANSK